MTKPVARLTSPVQLAAAVPEQLGFVPGESLVVLCQHEPRGRVGLVMRFDLPARAAEAPLAEDVARRVRHERATRIALVVYTDEPGRRPRTGLVEAVRERLGELQLTDALLVRDARAWSYVCEDVRCCPVEGTPLSQADSGSGLALLRAERVGAGRSVLPSRAALEALVAPPTFLAAVEAVQRLRAADEALRATVRAAGRGAAREAALSSWQAVLSRWDRPPVQTTDQEAASLVVSLDDVLVRDRVVGLSAAPGAAAAMTGLLEDLCRRTPAPYDAPVCTLLAWVSYAEGAGALTTVALDRALATDPAYALAVLLDQALQGQIPPARVRELSRRSREVA